jgi:uroporphyrin-III C-methyltransferase / precorrin-2 dehydrogenase / sirohydrochlorin ferrochelatase
VSRYPLSLDLHGRRVLLVGGGTVSARRVVDLVEAGAIIDIVSPELCRDLAAIVAEGAAFWQAREFAPRDLIHPTRAWLAHTATGDPAVDSAVAAAAEDAGIWCIHAGDATSSATWRPAVTTTRSGAGGEVQVAVTAGGDPHRAARLRDAIETALATGTLPVRTTRTRPTGGTVALVGGGPGPEDLLTVRGRTLLALADVVVSDRLGPRAVLDSLADDVEVIDVGKHPGNHPVPQDQINQLLVDRARRGLRVVRLKGGDPFVLGRGSEEAAHCLRRGIPVEVVPGVTSAVSVPAAAGIPVTHRGLAGSFVVATGHEGPEAVVAAARDTAPDATLVLLMAVSAVETIAEGLIRDGRRHETPVAVIEQGWTLDQRTTLTTLGGVAADCRRQGVRPPAVIVIGEVVALREQLGDLCRPLVGLPVTVSA